MRVPVWALIRDSFDDDGVEFVFSGSSLAAGALHGRDQRTGQSGQPAGWTGVPLSGTYIIHMSYILPEGDPVIRLYSCWSFGINVSSILDGFGQRRWSQ